MGSFNPELVAVGKKKDFLPVKSAPWCYGCKKTAFTQNHHRGLLSDGDDFWVFQFDKSEQIELRHLKLREADRPSLIFQVLPRE